MTEPSSVVVGTKDELWDGEMRAIRAFGEEIVLIRIKDQVRAYRDRCAHLGVRISQGTLDGCKLRCSAHHWEYDACTGQGLNPSSVRLEEFPVTIRGDQLILSRRQAVGTAATLAPPSEPSSQPQLVGPVLRMGKHARAIASAIRAKDTEAQIVERGAYLRVHAPNACCVTRASIEDQLGEPFAIPQDLEPILASFSGKMSYTKDEVRWSAL